MNYTEEELSVMTPQQYRKTVRSKEWTGQATYACNGYVHTGLVIIHRDYALDFLTFCTRNPKPCPVLEVGDPGDPMVRYMAKDADIRTDLSRYWIYKGGEVTDETTDIMEYWNDDMVFFLLGCSNTFDGYLRAADIKYEFLGAHVTNIQCEPAGPFKGRVITSNRTFENMQDALLATEISAQYPEVHGGPVHIGSPESIGIADAKRPEYKSLPEIAPESLSENSIPVFWACGMTPQLVAVDAKLPLLIGAAPGSVFITDLTLHDLANLKLKNYKAA